MNTVTFNETVAVISEETDAAEIIVRLGILEELTKKVALGGNVALLEFRHHPTHWILAGHFHNFENPADNGYCVFAWEKSAYPASVMSDQITMYEREFAPKKLADLQVTNRPKNN